MKNSVLRFLPVILFAFVASCESSDEQEKGSKKVVEEEHLKVKIPSFNSDSAYQYVQDQVAFGPRVPGTEAHSLCVDYLKGKLEAFGMKVLEQNGQVSTYDGKKITLRNVIASSSPEHTNRVLLAAHYDSRPIADRGSENVNKAIDGANDGASGVGVLLEVARCLREEKPNIGVDIVLFDVEDYGEPSFSNSGKPDTWCLGSQYWSKNPHKKGYYAKYGILLDMVGAQGAVFPWEGSSVYYAESVVKKVWKAGARLGFGAYFVNQKVNPITDDHVYINRNAGIPTIDIVHIDPGTNDFGPFHHTHNDNMAIINKNTLNAVGKTLIYVLYNES